MGRATPATLAAAAERLRSAVAGAGPLGLDTSVLDERDRAVLATLDGIVVSAGRAVLAGHGDPLAGHPFVAALEAAPFAPPSPDELGVDRAEVRELVRRGLVVEQDGLYFAAAAVDEAAARSWPHCWRRQPDGVDGRRPCAKRSGRRASGRCRCWPASTPLASPAAAATSASPGPVSHPR